MPSPGIRALLLPGTAREAFIHASILAGLGWLGVSVFLYAGTGDRSVFGPLKWGDFVHFYTIGHIARRGDVSLLYDGGAQHARQVALVPASAPDGYLPVYPPQTALLFAPLSVVPFHGAAVLWALATLTVCGWAAWVAWRPGRDALPDVRLVIVGVAAFPPFWLLVANGQTTAIPMLAFAAAWLALERRQPLLAGVALGLLALKPQFGIVIAAVAVLTAQWSLILGGLLSLAAQVALVSGWLGSGVFGTYLTRSVRHYSGNMTLLEPHPALLHSLEALTRWLPGISGGIVWALLSGVVIAATWRVWRVPASWRVRMGVLVLASVLVNPHLNVYDASVLLLPGLWLGAELSSASSDASPRWFWDAVYLLYVLTLVPTAAIVRVQLSVLVMSYVFWRTTRTPHATSR